MLSVDLSFFSNSSVAQACALPCKPVTLTQNMHKWQKNCLPLQDATCFRGSGMLMPA